MLPGMTPLVSQSVARVRAWLAASEETKTKIAADAGVDDKTVRLALKAAPWNPTAETLERLEKLIPPNWQPPKGKKRAA